MSIAFQRVRMGHARPREASRLLLRSLCKSVDSVDVERAGGCPPVGEVGHGTFVPERDFLGGVA